MTNQSDHTYIQQVLKGDTNAFSFLVRKYQDMVFSIALKMLQNREEAEDVAQEVFVKCYHSLGKYKGKAKFGSWLYRITYNACLDNIKSYSRNFNTTELIEHVHEGEVGMLENGIDVLEQKERNATIQNAIKQLSSDEQVIILLYYFEELPLKDIAEIVDVSLDNIKIKLFRSRKKLFKLLKNEVESLKRTV